MIIDFFKTVLLPWLPFFTAVVSGIFLLLGYSIQKNLEYKRAVAEKRRETYSMFLKSTFAGIESRKESSKSKQVFDHSEEIFWKAQISLYGSDEVIRRLGEWTILLPSSTRQVHVPADKIAVAFDDLILAMRNDITLKSRINLGELRKISPLLL
jgi:hypothetical protein